MTNQEVWDTGDDDANWPCDFNIETGEIESNGAMVHRIIIEGQTYFIVTDWAQENVHKPDDEAIPLIDPRS